MCQSKTRSLELHPVGGNAQVYDPEFFDLKAELDAAKKELQEIREAIKANPEESTVDEVKSLINRFETLSEQTADGFGDGYFEGYIDGGKRQEQEELNLKSDGGLARFSDYALRASEIAEGVKAERLGLSPRKKSLAAHDAEVAKAAFIAGYEKRSVERISIGADRLADQYAAQPRAKAVE